MVNEKITKAINNQITKEIYSSYLYLAIANYYTEKNLDGFANWFEVQAQEELDHMMLFRKYLQNDGRIVVLDKIDAPSINFKQLSEPLSVSLAHEQMITASIEEIYSESLSCKDYKTTQFLDWFIKEQGEEEKNANDLLNKYELFGSDSKGLYMLNAELLTRAYTAPSLIL